MSHYHLEIIMPPTDDVEKRVAEIMEPHSEHDEENYHAFWDWYVIGGRWGGEHLKTMVDPEKLAAYNQELTDMGITVSGVVCGKQELSPADQIPKVDALWREYFPESELKACPLFQHFNNQYQDNCLDVDTVSALGPHLTAFKLMICGLDYKGEKYTCETMYDVESWNGHTFQETDWNGEVLNGINRHNKKLAESRYKPEFIERLTVKPDWMAVTVDYHC